MEDRKETISLKKIIRDSIIPGLEEDEAINRIIRNRVERVIVSF